MGLTVNNASLLPWGKNRFHQALSQQMAAFSIKWLRLSHFLAVGGNVSDVVWMLQNKIQTFKGPNAPIMF